METHEFDKIDLLEFATGACAEVDAARISAHLTSCASCRSFVEEFRSENAAFLSGHPYEVADDAAAPKPRIVAFRWRRVYGIAALVALMVTTGSFFLLRDETGPTRVKGATGLKLYVKNADGAIEIREKQVYRAGERIQFSYSCDKRNKFLLLSIDTSGVITRYYPVAGDSSEALEPGQDIPLSHSILLDDYAGRELFIGIFSEEKIRADLLRDSLAAGFNRTHEIDSIGLAVKNAFVWKLPIVTIKGTR
jgi:hypothetical protein